MKLLLFFLGLLCSFCAIAQHKDGVSITYDSAHRIVDSSIYQNNHRIITSTYSYYKGASYEYNFRDSINDSRVYKYADSTGQVITEGHWEKKDGYLRQFVDGHNLTRSARSSEIREAEFPGGAPTWRIFILNNLDANVPVKKKAKNGTYQVIVRFIVNVDGTLSDFEAETNFGHGMEKEVLRLLKKSPNWVPAIMFGVPVKAYRRQPVTFVVSD